MLLVLNAFLNERGNSCTMQTAKALVIQTFCLFLVQSKKKTEDHVLNPSNSNDLVAVTSKKVWGHHRSSNLEIRLVRKRQWIGTVSISPDDLETLLLWHCSKPPTSDKAQQIKSRKLPGRSKRFYQI